MSELTKEQWAQTYPMSVTAWELSKPDKEYLVTGDGKYYIEYDLSSYAYFFHNKMTEEIYDKIKSLEAELSEAKFLIKNAFMEHHLDHLPSCVDQYGRCSCGADGFNDLARSFLAKYPDKKDEK